MCVSFLFFKQHFDSTCRCRVCVCCVYSRHVASFCSLQPSWLCDEGPETRFQSAYISVKRAVAREGGVVALLMLVPHSPANKLLS